MKAFSTHILIDLKSGLRDKSLLLTNYLLPLGFYFVLGAIMPKLNQEFTHILVPSMMIFGILVSTILGMPNTLVTLRNSGIFRSYKINGVSKISMLAVPSVSTIMHTIIVTAIILLTAPILFEAKSPESILGLILVFISTVIVFSGLALLIGIIANDTSVTVIFAQIVFLPSMLIGGLMIPFSFLPKSVAVFSKLLPTTYAMDAYQALALNAESSFDPIISLCLLVSSGILSFFLSWYLFRLDNNKTSKSKSLVWGLSAIIPFALAAIFL